MKHFATLLLAIFCLAAEVFAQVQFTAHTITTNAHAAQSVYAADVYGDGDLDVLSASELDGKIAWYENNGNQNFTEHTIMTEAIHAQSVYVADVDGDGDLDVLFASRYNNKIAWYENQDMATAVIDSRTSAVPEAFAVQQNYPNPFWSEATPRSAGNPTTIIQYEIPHSTQVKLTTYNLPGEKIRTLVDAHEPAGVRQTIWDGRNDLGQRVSSGVYLYHLEAGAFTMTRRLVLMK